MTWGNSLGSYGPRRGATPLNNPTIAGVGIDSNGYDEGMEEAIQGRIPHHYLEVQIHGSMDLGECNTVVFHKNCFDHDHYTGVFTLTPTCAKLGKEFQKSNIEVKIEPKTT